MLINRKRGIYGIRRKETGDLYVGSAVCIQERWYEHRKDLRRGVHHCRYLQRAWTKYGEAAFEFLIIEEIEDKDALLDAEQAHIDALKPAYNSLKVAGSSLGFKHSPETIEKLKGNKNILGYKFTPEQRARCTAAQKGKVRSPEQRDRLATLFKGRSHTPETRAKLSEAMRGRKKPPRTAEHKAALSRAALRFYGKDAG